MVLAVDIGNTNIVMGCFESDRILFVERLSTNQQSTALEYAIMLKNILEIHSIDMSDFRGGIISSVVPSVTLTMKEAMERLIKKRIMVVGPGIKTGRYGRVDTHTSPELAVTPAEEEWKAARMGWPL